MTATNSNPTAALPLAAAKPDTTPVTASTSTSTRQPPLSACARCGQAIARRRHGDACPHCRAPLDLPPELRLESADLVWLRQIGWGALAVGGALAFHLGGSWFAYLQHDPLRGATLQVFGSVLGALGVWVLTIPEDPQRRLALLAQIARLSASMAILLWFAATLIASRQGEIQWSVALALTVMAVESVALGLYVGPLARRIPHPGLARQFRSFILLLPPFFAFLIVYQFVEVMNTDTYFFFWLPLVGAYVGVMLWIAATMVRLFTHLGRTAIGAEVVMQKHFAAAQAVAKNAAAQSDGAD